MNEVPEDEIDFDEDLIYTFRGVPFTGVGYEEADGRRVSAVCYLDGKQDGYSRSWYDDGSLREEFCYRQNSLHGKHVLYDADGRLRLEELYEYGILLSKVERNAEGEFSAIFELKSTDPQWKTLNEFRNHFQW
ncbi:toxin-antitoxin system YwqK family antitoxin [Streptomyces mirabilis]|uniref:toxin-antitoxin system YwqK family antitoxin n=1 Tax=Streptomyces TaxID=1883 RepID=UPI000BB0DF56|nr:hypothetical protein [Streptomyces sp. Ag82_O1-15]PBC98984.1 hypothetical protein BX281_7077 [Streptomyces sp. Ag82_O1-15]